MKNTKSSLLAIFFLLGMSSIIYEISWQRLLSLYYGVASISTTIIISVFMFGLGFGAILGGKYIDKCKNKPKIFLIIVFLTSFFGFISTNAINFIGSLTAGSNYFLTFFYIFIFLSFPTFLIGAAFPIFFSIVNDLYPNFFKNISLIYFVNSIGAAFGSLISAFILIAFLGIKETIYFAAFLDIMLALFFYVIVKNSLRKKSININSKREHPIKNSGLNINLVCILVFISGFMALGYEIVWIRIAKILTNSSSYYFASTLFVYLLGIGIGSFFMYKIISRFPKLYDKSLFFLFQFIIGLTAISSFIVFYYMMKNTIASDLLKLSNCVYLYPVSDSLNMSMLRNLPLFSSYLKEILGHNITLLLSKIYINLSFIIWQFFFVLLPALFMGASFPLLASLVNKKDKVGEVSGKVYFYNILGNVFGVLITGFLLLPLIKTIGTIVIFFLAGLLLLLFVDFSKLFGFRKRKTSMIKKLVILISIFFLIATIMPSNDHFYSQIYFSQRYFQEDVTHINFKVEEGIGSVAVAATDNLNNYEQFSNGVNQGQIPNIGKIAQSITQLSYLNKLNNLDVLVIGLGAGVLIEPVLMLDNVSSVTVVEINKELVKSLIRHNKAKSVIENPRINLIIDDGRRFLYRSNKTYDIIFINNPIREVRENSNNLYSKEFFSLIKSHLKEKGVLGIYNSREEKIYPTTILEEFEYLEVYNYYALVSNSPLKKNIMIYDSLLKKFDKKIQDQIKDIPVNLLFNQNSTNLPKNGKINTDNNPWLEYYYWKIIKKDSKLLIGDGCPMVKERKIL